MHRLGSRSDCGTLRAPPSAERVAGFSPAELDACGLAPKRSIALVRAAREVASGRADLLAFEGQGRDDILPALDLAYVKLVGDLAGLGREDASRGLTPPDPR